MKSKTLSYIFWLFGCHRFYLGDIRTGILQFLTLGGLGIWWLIDLFRIGTKVEVNNDKIHMLNRVRIKDLLKGKLKDEKELSDLSKLIEDNLKY